ncbi:hypothetical protein P170DRAFT_111663 [Aspergillus steynii IBT 23096]|uniref:Uncharacterized protein n=1 Tax=Aspergillus steynii IBT 23096 TaxID=1392250 RepID=A0A2I2GIR0_9EURO|nr:uncharacterized protein P170DRAFT_111663 [Aspergillus steynii IBT 23096]PLB52748.1 hypothetical protein P170DRAFT_111663 [Aspergillus steynii IBT 23096]
MLRNPEHATRCQNRLARGASRINERPSAGCFLGRRHARHRRHCLTKRSVRRKRAPEGILQIQNTLDRPFNIGSTPLCQRFYGRINHPRCITSGRRH